MNKSCPKCGRSMEEGFVIDGRDYGSQEVADWHRGQPERKWWGLKTNKAEVLKIVSWRCTGCGLLENYAR